MTTAPHPQMMTADQLLALADDGRRYELVRGELRAMAPSAYLPGAVAGRALASLAGYVFPRGLGDVGSADSGFTLARNPDTVRAPDVWFVRADRVPTGETASHFFPGAPDLAVEVLSPSDRFVDVMSKVRDYLAAGTSLVWVIDPIGRSAAVFQRGAIPRLIDEDDALDGGDVLPGYSVALRDLFPLA